MAITYNKKALLSLILIGLCGLLYFLHALCTNDKQLDSILISTKERILQLRKKVDHLDNRHLRTIGESNIILYLITPTYTRYTQQADLVRLSNTLKHVSALHWIVVEDSDIKTKLVKKVLNESGITHTHLNIKTQKDLRRGRNDPRWKKHRGVDQRNLGLKWLRESTLNRDRGGVVYFADDDNTYHLDLFKEMRSTQAVSMWPVALVGGLRWEGPVCKDGKIVKFFTAWMPSRIFPVDMAAFAFNIKLLFQNPNAYINPEIQRGYLESDFLEQLKVQVRDVEAKADDCTRILVWHTQTAEPNMRQEIRLQQHGYGSDLNVVI